MSERLERRHRRLLAIFYPAAHRRRYEGEMLGVLLAGARPGQRWPSVRDAANLAGHGLRARLSAAGTGAVSPAWADAVAVTALLGALVLLSQRVLRVLQYLVLPGPDLPLSTVARAVAWAAVVVAILAGWRRIAAACAWLTVAAEAAMLAMYYVDWPDAARRTLAAFALGVLVAIALAVTAPRRRALAVLGRVRLGVFLLALAVVQGLRLLQDAMLLEIYDAGTFYVYHGLEASAAAILYLMLGILAACGIAALLAVATLPRPVRRRVLALAVPMAVLGGGLTVYWNGDLGGLTALYWLVLAGVPVVALVFRAAAARGAVGGRGAVSGRGAAAARGAVAGRVRRDTEDASGV